MLNVLNKIVTRDQDDAIVVYTIGDIIEGYYDSLNDKFYKEPTFETEIEGAEGFLYIDKAENKTYRYNIDELTYILTSGGGDSIVHVKKLPDAADIEDKIYIVGKDQETVTTTATEANIDGLYAFNKIVNEDDNIISWSIKNKYTVYLDDGDPATDNMNVIGIVRDSSNNYTFSDGTNTTVFAQDAAFTVEVLGPVNTYLGNKDNGTVMSLDKEIVRVTELPLNPNIEDKVYLYDDYEEVVVSDGYTTLSGTANPTMFETAPLSNYFIPSGDEYIVNNAWIAYLDGKLDKPILKVINNLADSTLEVVFVDSGEAHMPYLIDTDTITFKITDVAHPTPDPITVIQLTTYYYLGDNVNQTLIPLSGGGSSYRQGFGIRIDAGAGNEISTTDFVGTEEQWEALEATEKNKYDFLFFDDTYNTESYPGHGIQDKDNVIKPSRKLMQLKDFKITDDPDANKTIVEEIPYTAGEGIDIDADEKEISVSDEVPKVWTGTKAEWAAIADKSVYDGWLIDITDDVLEGSQPVVDVVEEGNYNPVTSNAVSQYISGGGSSSTTWNNVTNKPSQITYLSGLKTENNTAVTTDALLTTKLEELGFGSGGGGTGGTAGGYGAGDPVLLAIYTTPSDTDILNNDAFKQLKTNFENACLAETDADYYLVELIRISIIGGDPLAITPKISFECGPDAHVGRSIPFSQITSTPGGAITIQTGEVGTVNPYWNLCNISNTGVLTNASKGNLNAAHGTVFSIYGYKIKVVE